MLRAALLLLALLLPAVLAAPVSNGPWAGTVRQGEWDSHWFQNVPSGVACPVYPWGQSRMYAVTLTYAPPTDTVVLHYAGRQVVGQHGVATLTYDGSSCQARWFTVEGRSVAAEAAYAVNVAQLGPTRNWSVCGEVCVLA